MGRIGRLLLIGRLLVGRLLIPRLGTRSIVVGTGGRAIPRLLGRLVAGLRLGGRIAGLLGLLGGTGLGPGVVTEIDAQLGGHAMHLAVQSGYLVGQFGIVFILLDLLAQVLDLGVEPAQFTLGVFQLGPHVGLGVEGGGGVVARRWTTGSEQDHRQAGSRQGADDFAPFHDSLRPRLRPQIR